MNLIIRQIIIKLMKNLDSTALYQIRERDIFENSFFQVSMIYVDVVKMYVTLYGV